MKTIDSGIIKNQINKCYLEYDPYYPRGIGNPDLMNGFKYWLEHKAGIRLEFSPEIKNGQMGYGMKRVEIVDESKFTMFLMRYSS